MKNGSSVSAHEEACVRVAARFEERWLRTYVNWKLRADPIYLTAFDLFRNSDQPLVDIGCGVGLLAFYLRERNFLAPISGFDRDGRKIERANTVARGACPGVEFIEQDVCEPLKQTGNIVLFDVLHYLRPDEQSRLLERFAARLAPGELVVIRDCPRDGNMRFWLTSWAERFAQATTWNIKVPLYFPSRKRIFAAFGEDHFSCTVQPLRGNMPFNNHLFIFRRRAAGTARR